MTSPRNLKAVIRQWKNGVWPKRSSVATDPLQSVEWIGAVGDTTPPPVGGHGMAANDFYEQRAAS